MTKKKRIVIILIAIIAVILVLDIGVRIFGFITKSDFEQINFDTATEYSLYPYKNDILMINSDGMRLMDEHGKEKWYAAANNVSPSVDISGDYILIYDMQGTTLKLYNGKNLVTNLKTEEKITSAKVNKSGQFLVVSDEAGFKSGVTVYNSNGEEKYKWHSGTYYISDADIAPLGNKIALSQIDVSGQSLKTIITLINISNEEVTDCKTYENSLTAVLKFNKDGSFVTLSNSMLSGFTASGGHKYDIDLSGKEITSFNLDNDDNMVLNTVNSHNNTTFEFYAKDGKKRGECLMNSRIKTFAVNGEVIITNVLRDIFKITPNGKIKNCGAVNHDIKDICIYGNRKKAIIVGGSCADLVSF